MPTAAAALRAAIHNALVGDGALNALLGGPKVYDEPPRGADFPYVTLGDARVTDYSAGGEPGEEHQVVLHGWSQQGGHRDGLRPNFGSLAGRVFRLRHDGGLVAPSCFSSVIGGLLPIAPCGRSSL
jgi:hypothetical protein